MHICSTRGRWVKMEWCNSVPCNEIGLFCSVLHSNWSDIWLGKVQLIFIFFNNLVPSQFLKKMIKQNKYDFTFPQINSAHKTLKNYFHSPSAVQYHQFPQTLYFLVWVTCLLPCVSGLCCHNTHIQHPCWVSVMPSNQSTYSNRTTRPEVMECQPDIFHMMTGKHTIILNKDFPVTKINNQTYNISKFIYVLNLIWNKDLLKCINSLWFHFYNKLQTFLLQI